MGRLKQVQYIQGASTWSTMYAIDLGARGAQQEEMEHPESNSKQCLSSRFLFTRENNPM